MLEWGWGSSSPSMEREHLLPKSDGQRRVWTLDAEEPTPLGPIPASHQGLPQAPLPVPGAVLSAQDALQLRSLSDLHFCAYCSWTQFETTPGEDDMLRECENSGHDGGTSHRGMGSWDLQVIPDSATRPPGCLLPKVPLQLPVLPMPDHLSVLPISPCHSQRFAQSSPFNWRWNLPTWCEALSIICI